MKYYECKKRTVNKIISSRDCWACWHGLKQVGEQFAETRFKCVEENAKEVEEGGFSTHD